MAFNLDYSREGDTVEVIIRDVSGRKMDRFRIKAKEFYKITSILKNKYGVKFKPEVDKDLNWLKKRRF